MNRAFVTTPDGRLLHSKDEALSAWHDGKPFRLYNYGPITQAESWKLLIAGFTHVCFVWQDAQLQVRHLDLEIKPRVIPER